jgi:isoquinoline 1-oxidoreductase subunit beta
MKPFNPDRRKFLKLSAATVGSSLVLGISWTADSAAAEERSQPFQPNAWLRIESTGIITIFIAEAEMGQGTYTSLPMLVAEELEADWASVRVKHASLDPIYGFQGTGGSRSIQKAWKTLREAGAIARQMLKTAGAKHLNVPIEQCQVQTSKVIHQTTGRSVKYAELVGSAARLPIPKSVKLKTSNEFNIIGHSLPRLDLAAKLNGSARYGIDVKLPEMLYATIAQSPEFGGLVKNFNASAIKQRSGILDCFAIDEGVVVVAKSTWQAFQARQALEIEWHQGANVQLDNDRILQSLADDAALPPAEVIFESGEPLAQLQTQSDPIKSRYLLPFQAHMTPEPMNCTVQFHSDKLKIWAPTQSPSSAKKQAIAALSALQKKTAVEASGNKLQPQVEVETTLLGGGFGRRIQQDYVTQAVKIAHRFKQPVQLIWPRDEDVQHDYYHPLTQHHLRGILDKQGLPIVWHHLITGLDAYGYGAEQPQYAIPHIRVEVQRQKSPIPVGPWRSVSHHYNTFAVEHFFDELATAGGHDPLELRLKLLTQPRLKATLEIAAEAAAWQQQDDHRILGCAVHSGFGSHITEIVELLRDDEQTVKLGKIFCVMDCGQVISPDGVKAQLEGSIIFALSAALNNPITIKNGRVEQSNFHDYKILSFRETPEIEIIITSNQHDPGGVGEPGVPPLAPALANALLVGSGNAAFGLPLKLT